ncbi:MAG: hypothetical protein LBS76_02430 [Mycoplasmataceae bacterium]|nr:hypothetical protein [Mycoplasmataceae bacterium]
MYEGGIDLDTIAMVLGNAPRVVQQHYILSSRRNFDACEIASAFMWGKILKSSNMFVNPNWMTIDQRPTFAIYDETKKILN